MAKTIRKNNTFKRKIDPNYEQAILYDKVTKIET